MDPAENPFAVLSKADASMYSFKGGTDTDKAGDGSVQYVINMVPKDKGLSFTSLRITVTADTFLPCAVTYASRTGDRYELQIVSVSSVEAVGILRSVKGADGRSGYLYYRYALAATAARPSQRLHLWTDRSVRRIV